MNPSNTTPEREILAGLPPAMDWLTETYKQLHRHPELSFQEHETSALVSEQLTNFGYSVQHIGGTGVVGVLANGLGPTVMSRADMDALPVTEATGLPYASETEGVMHACGHDVHVTALLGAARLMAESQSAWSGTFAAVFQPAEEAGGGSRIMVGDGLVGKVPRPDVVLGQHVMPLPAGTLATAAGPVLSAADSMKITVHGKGSHGSMPHMSVDPVVLAASIVLKLQTIVSRETRPGEFAVVTVGALNAGTKSNIIPDRATLLLNIRNYDDAVRTRVLAAIKRIVEGECAAAGSPKKPEFEFYDQFPLTSNDASATELITDAFASHFGQDSVQQADRQTASEDFSAIPDAFGAPYSYRFLGGSDPQAYQAAVKNGTVDADIPANHSPYFAPVIHPTLAVGVQAHVVAAMAYLGGRMPSISN
ncbi:amidohydrolase [Arthrobacter alpinus]|uniref:amidohydrolase n=1 Tax=Arthrobacter alpinus TaxID=656366 RepID=UPI0005C81B3E|nr:amidohydrolase [Arthrobacter alpinus]ALV45112.1 amidohydrolase [Arthrobacter alpinus]